MLTLLLTPLLAGRSLDTLCHAGACGNERQRPLPILPTPAPALWEPLPLGSLAPRGWLLEQLITQANGLSGYMPHSTFPGAATLNSSMWLGGDGKPDMGVLQWLPYWMNGNVPLLMLLRAAGPSALARLDAEADLPRVVDGIVAYVLSHTNKTSGWIGPYLNEPGDVNGHGLWDPLNMLRALLMYAEATPSAARRIAQAVVAHLTAEARQLRADPVYKWASTRWPTFVQVCLYAIDRLVPTWGDDAGVMPLGADATRRMLMEAARLFRDKGMDWRAYYTRTGPVKFPSGSVAGWNVNDHGVNNAEGAMAWPAMDARLGGEGAGGRDAMRLVLSMLREYQAQPNALFCADEVFCGRAPHRGTETCAVVEAMASLEQAFSVFGDPELYDEVEALGFNALPAALTADMWTHVYVQQANSVFAGDTRPAPRAVDLSRRSHALREGHGSHRPAGSGEMCDATGDGDGDGVGGGVGDGVGGGVGDARGDGGGRCGRRLQHDTPSGEDQTANFYGVSHFPCCITNFPQGWPKLAASAVLANASANGFVVASLLPLEATLPAAVGGGARVRIESSYPFGDEASVEVTVDPGHNVTAHIRIPRWASGASVGGAPARNGTLHAVDCAEGVTRIAIVLPMRLRVERGWGVHEQPAAAPVVFNASAGAAAVPAADEGDWELQGGATLVGSREAGEMDVRSGNPGEVSWLVNRHPIYGVSHALAAANASFRYAAGYTPPAGGRALGALVSLHVLDMETRADLGGALIQWPSLDNYSFDNYHGYSPPMPRRRSRLSVANAKPVLLALRIDNRQRNVQLPLASLRLSVRWAPTPSSTPPTPVSNYTSPAANAAVVRRGPLLLALHPDEDVRTVREYPATLPRTRHLAVDYEISTRGHWAYALVLATDGEGLAFDPTPSAGWSLARPFATDQYPFSALASARRLGNGTWGYWEGSAITAQPPASPLDCAAADCGTVETIRLVPFGATNIRISVFPWVSWAAVEARGGGAVTA